MTADRAFGSDEKQEYEQAITTTPIDKPLRNAALLAPTSGFVPPTTASRHKPTRVRRYLGGPHGRQRVLTAAAKCQQTRAFSLRFAWRVTWPRTRLKLVVSPVDFLGF